MKNWGQKENLLFEQISANLMNNWEQKTEIDLMILLIQILFLWLDYTQTPLVATKPE